MRSPSPEYTAHTSHATVVIVRAGVVDERGGDPCGRPGVEVFADEPDSMAGLLFLRRDLGSFVVIVRAGEVDERGGDPCGRPGGIRYNWVYFLPDT